LIHGMRLSRNHHELRACGFYCDARGSHVVNMDVGH
jgi:hypothetical protein